MSQHVFTHSHLPELSTGSVHHPTKEVNVYANRTMRGGTDGSFLFQEELKQGRLSTGWLSGLHAP